jgi:hypothetical protein
MITKRHITLWLHSLLKHAAVSDDVLNIVTVMQGDVTVETPKQGKSGMTSHHIFQEKRRPEQCPQLIKLSILSFGILEIRGS